MVCVHRRLTHTDTQDAVTMMATLRSLTIKPICSEALKIPKTERWLPPPTSAKLVLRIAYLSGKQTDSTQVSS